MYTNISKKTILFSIVQNMTFPLVATTGQKRGECEHTPLEYFEIVGLNRNPLVLVWVYQTFTVHFQTDSPWAKLLKSIQVQLEFNYFRPYNCGIWSITDRIIVRTRRNEIFYQTSYQKLLSTQGVQRQHQKLTNFDQISVIPHAHIVVHCARRVEKRTVFPLKKVPRMCRFLKAV